MSKGEFLCGAKGAQGKDWHLLKTVRRRAVETEFTVDKSHGNLRKGRHKMISDSLPIQVITPYNGLLYIS